MKILYLDVFSGISGDMFLGAMLDLGLELRHLQSELRKVNLAGYHLHAVRAQNSQIEGVKFDVHLEKDHHHHGADDVHAHDHAHVHAHDHGQPAAHDHGHDSGHTHHHHEHSHAHHTQDEGRDFAGIKELILASSLSGWVKEKAVAVFTRVAAAEGKIHGIPPERVHFHEVGAVDSIVDIVGACIALESLGRPRVLAASVVDGTGWVQCAHGRFPVPTPATLEILGARGIPLTQCAEPSELVTPTGAALLAEFAESFGPMQDLVPARIGYGLGSRQNQTRPNVLRAVLGQSLAAEGKDAADHRDWEKDTVAVLESNLDDCSGEILGHFVERALAAGALDVFHTPVQMKKNRPGVLLTVLCDLADSDRFSEMILLETSAFGVRRSTVERRKLQRETVTAATPFGEVTLKLGKWQGTVLHATPEFESCKRIAVEAGVPLATVYRAAEQAGAEWRGKLRQ